MAKLTAARVKALMVPGFYGDGAGLYLQVRSAANRSWVFRFKLHKTPHLMGLGAVGDVSLADAREAATTARKLVRQGVNPIDQRKIERAEAAARAGLHTFSEVADAYIAAHEDGWRNPKHRQQWRNTIDTYAAPVFGKMPVAQVAVGDVMRVLEPIWRKKTETASRLRGRIELVLDYATARGWRTGENPARWKGHLENLLPARAKVAKPEHHAALPWKEIGAFMVALAAEEGVSPLALRFAILTAARTNEALGARWSEIDADAAIWTVPADRMKAGREHRVPLSRDALAVLTEAAKVRTVKTPEAYVFPGLKDMRPLSNMAMLMLLRRMGRDDLTAHGFRSTFRDWCAEATNYPGELAEAALAHTVKNKVEAAYQRGDLIERRRPLMAGWAAFCAKPWQAAGKVVQIRAGVAA